MVTQSGEEDLVPQGVGVRVPSDAQIFYNSMIINCEKIDINSYQISNEEYNQYFNKCKEHCKGCLNEHSNLCSDTDVIDCYLHSLLPDGIWHKAVTNSLINKNTKELSTQINKRIKDKLNEALGLG